MRTRSLGLGSTTLQAGTDLYGYYGKYQGIITPNELVALAGITQGVTISDADHDPSKPITWLKFSHNYKTLFVADRAIQHSISWDHLNSKDLVFGKVVDIDGQKYLLRLLQSSYINPTPSTNGLVTDANSEWHNLILNFTPDGYTESFWNMTLKGCQTWLQETLSDDLGKAIAIGGMLGNTVRFSFNKNSKTDNLGYRPVLEVL